MRTVVHVNFPVHYFKYQPGSLNFPPLESVEISRVSGNEYSAFLSKFSYWTSWENFERQMMRKHPEKISEIKKKMSEYSDCIVGGVSYTKL